MPDIMDEMDIAFPHIGIYLHNVPKTIYIGNFTIAMYGVILAFGMLCGILLSAHIAKKTGQDPDLYWDAAIWLIVFALIGARLYYVIFFFREGGYDKDPLQILNFRGGGLAIYGGVIGGVLTLILYARKKKQNFFRMLDTASFGLVLGQIIGRWANFCNREVFGSYTDSLFAMRIPVSMVRARDIDEAIAAHMTDATNYIQVHPTFLYESLWNVGVLLIMLAQVRKKRFDGRIALTYFAGYGIGRGLIELIRTDQLYISGTKIPVNMVVGFTVAMVCITIMIVVQTKVKAGTVEAFDYGKVPEYVQKEKDI